MFPNTSVITIILLICFTQSLLLFFVFPTIFLTSSRKLQTHFTFSCVIQEALKKCVKLSLIEFYTLCAIDNFHHHQACTFFKPAFQNNLIREHNSPQWVEHFNQSCAFFFFCNLIGVSLTHSLIPHTEQYLCFYQSPTACEALSVPLSFATNMRFKFPLMAISLEVAMIVLFGLFVQYETDYSALRQTNSSKSIDEFFVLYPREQAIYLLLYIFRFSRFSECEIFEFSNHLSSTLELLTESYDSYEC